jgi:hypothetical protein
MPPEGLWWVEDMNSFRSGQKDDWLWTMMIAQPEFITREMVETAIVEVTKKKNSATISKLRFETFAEGLCAQIMHIGPFSAEGPNIEKVHQFIADRGCTLNGKHHEIYLSDIRRAAPEKWKTIIRQPMHQG